MIPEHKLLLQKMKRIDKFLYKMNTEILWYTYKKAESILNFRANKENE